MTRHRAQILLGVVVIITVLITGCRDLSQAPQKRQTILVGAAASLNEAFTELGDLFEKEYPRWQVEFHFAGSGSIKTSIEQGAPLDVFAPAAEKQMEILTSKKLIDPSSVKVFARNRLVLIAPDTGLDKTIKDILKAERIAMGTPETVPAGQYAQESLINLGLFRELEPKMVYTKDVRQSLFYVEQNEVGFAFVYHTDAVKSKKVKIVSELPRDSYSPILYPIGIVAETPRSEGAQKWVEFVLSEKGQEVLANYGFEGYKTN